MPGYVPELAVVGTTPSGVTIRGFASAGQDALDWWARLRTGLVPGHWPILMDEDAPEYFGMPGLTRKPATAAENLALAETMNGAALLDRYAGDRFAGWPPAGRGQRSGTAGWPARPYRRGFQLPFDRGRPYDVIVGLVPAAEGWQVPAVLDYGGWHEYPPPAEHTAILRYWHDRYGADLVVLTGATAEFAVRRPPLTRAEALELAGEWRVYNDGQYDLYQATTEQELAASLLGAPVWLAWWD